MTIFVGLNIGRHRKQIVRRKRTRKDNSGHAAAAPPMSVMKSRRFTARYLLRSDRKDSTPRYGRRLLRCGILRPSKRTCARAWLDSVRRDWPGADSYTAAISPVDRSLVEPIKGGQDQSPKFDRDGERQCSSLGDTRVDVALQRRHWAYP